MTIKIQDHDFDGPFADENDLDSKSGVYAVLCASGEGYSLVDCGESEDVRNRIVNHDRRECWLKNCNKDSLAFAAFYCDEFTRMAIEVGIRMKHELPCGKD